MKRPWIDSATTLRDRMSKPSQVNSTDPEVQLPPYLESFLAHLRLLVGVPFTYLVPDQRLLPDESIRFFYVDRNWTDRLVDGAMAVGKIGTRDQALHQAHAGFVYSTLDMSERIVRKLQRAISDFATLKTTVNREPADVVTGFLLRSAAVSGWPHMDVRAYNRTQKQDYKPSEVPETDVCQTLRLERLAPAVMIALFSGVPELVVLEEPHHGVQFGVHPNEDGHTRVELRQPDGTRIALAPTDEVVVPFRAGGHRVVHIAELRKRLAEKRIENIGGVQHLEAIEQTGSAGFAVTVLDPPWRQRFEGTVDEAKLPPEAAPVLMEVAAKVQREEILREIENLVKS